MLEPKRTIVEIFNYDTQQQESVLELISQKEELIVQLRTIIEERIQAKNPLYVCNICGQTVVLFSRRINNCHIFYFKHFYDSGDCPIKTNSSYTKEEILRMKYNGAKESEAHFELKHYIANQLKTDKRFSNIEVEKVVKGTGWSKEWKKPDISALYNGKKVVFEIQLSTTFLSIIVNREIFYRKEKIPIFWIFKDLNPEIARMFEKDIFFNNNTNALSVDDFSKESTIKEGQLVFSGYFIVPCKNYTDTWTYIPVKMEDIKFDAITHKPYFILQNQLSEELKSKYLDAGFLLALLSVRDNKVYFRTQGWLWLANYVYHKHLKYWRVFVIATKKYERKELENEIKNDEKLKIKHQEFKDNLEKLPENRNSKFIQERILYHLFELLLSKLKGNL